VPNDAPKGIPPESVRYHTLYGSSMGRGAHDLVLEHIVDLVLKINSGACCFEAASPRRDHEWRLWGG